VYKKESNIPGIGYGLFAGEDIRKGSLIAEFVGKKVHNTKVTDHWSSVYFPSKNCIQCDKTNLASYANDIILFPTEKRDLIKIVESKEPFYQSYNNQSPNSSIYQNDDLERAWLKAERDIKKDDEIFVHYGIQFWLRREASHVEEPWPIPADLFETESFLKYVNTFYPELPIIEHGYVGDNKYISLTSPDGSGIIFDMDMIVNPYH